MNQDPFMEAAIAEARKGLAEGGIPIGSVLVRKEEIIGRGHNRRVQHNSSILHGEMDALKNAGRQAADVYSECIIYTTLSPCAQVLSYFTGFPKWSSVRTKHLWAKRIFFVLKESKLPC